MGLVKQTVCTNKSNDDKTLKIPQGKLWPAPLICLLFSLMNSTPATGTPLRFTYPSYPRGAMIIVYLQSILSTVVLVHASFWLSSLQTTHICRFLCVQTKERHWFLSVSSHFCCFSPSFSPLSLSSSWLYAPREPWSPGSRVILSSSSSLRSCCPPWQVSALAGG